jgi:hypothetical protein
MRPTSVLPVASMMRSSRKREEAHWNSFRGEVSQLQQTLIESLLKSDNSSKTAGKKKGDEINITKGSHAASHDGDETVSAAKNNSKQFEASAQHRENDTILCNDGRKENKLLQSQLQLSPLEELDDSAEIIEDENNDNATQTHHHHYYLELIGMEEVDKSICSVNNKNNLDDIPMNNAMSHASQNTNALSIATQELAEMKLKLALTESERDELEFELIQSKYSNDGA